MEYNYLLAFLLLGCLNLCAVAGLKVELHGGANKMEKPGAATTLTCTLDQGLPVILSHKIQWVHVPIDDPEQRDPDGRREEVLTNQKTLTDQASPDHYQIDVNYNDTHCTFTLTLKDVQAKNDGFYICRATNNEDIDDKAEATADIIVVNDVETVTMQFDGEESITEMSDVVVQREEGQYGLTCTAFGFNPDASIHISLGDKELETGGTQIMPDWDNSKTAGARRYSATANVPRLDLGAVHSGQKLKCSAVAGFEGAKAVEVSVPISVIAFEPMITCDQNVSAMVGQNYVKIKCQVEHPNVAIERYIWEIGKTGETIVPDQPNKNYHEVTVERLDEDTAIVTLDLFQVDDSHFDTYYFLDVFTKNGKYREEAALIKVKNDETGSSTKTSAVLLVCLLSVMLSLFNCY